MDLNTRCAMMKGETSSKTRATWMPWVIPLLAFAILSGCASSPASYRANPQFEERLRTRLKVALLPPDVKVYQRIASGSREPMTEWSETARKNVQEAIRKRLRGDPRLSMLEFDPMNSDATRKEFEDANSLFQAVALSVDLHTYQPGTQFKNKMDRFDYSLGPLPALAEASEADALLFVRAVDHDWILPWWMARADPPVRLAAAPGFTASPAQFSIAPNFFFFPPIFSAGPAPAIMWAALVDSRTGDIVWFNKHLTNRRHKLRDPASAEAFVAQAFEAFEKTFAADKPGIGKRP
jgi:hypothetical protein